MLQRPLFFAQNKYVGILDQIEERPEIAYALVRLYADYSDALIFAYASTTGAVCDVYADPSGYISTSSIAIVTTAGTSGFSVGQSMAFSSFYGSQSVYIGFYNQTGGSNNATNSTATTRPRLVNSGTFETMGGYPAARFISASSNFLQMSNIGSASAYTGCAVFKSVAVPPATNNGPVLGDFGTDGNADHWTWTDSTIYDGFARTNRSVVGTTSPTIANASVLTLQSNASTGYTVRINASQKYNTSVGSVALYSGTHYLGRSAKSGTNFYWDGYLCSMFAFKTALSASSITAIEAAQAAAFGI